MASLINRMMSERMGVPPKVGEGATICGWSDRHAATVVRVSASGKTCWIQEDEAIVVSGSCHDGSAKYRFERNPSAPIQRVYRTKRGWRITRGDRVSIGVRSEYYDPHF